MTNLKLKQISEYISKIESIDIASRFLDLIQKYDLKFLSYPDYPGKSFFLSIDLATSKGLESGDFQKNYASDLILTTPEKKGSSDVEIFSHKYLAGTLYKVRGDSLRRVKRLYSELYSTDLGRINSLWILDWRAAFSYLVQGSTQTTKQITRDLLEVGADAVENVTRDYIAKPKVSEWEIAQQLCFLINLAKLPFWFFELEAPNIMDSRVRSRRFDLTHIMGIRGKGKAVEKYELKPDIIYEQDIRDKLEACDYFNVARNKHKTDNVKLIFIAPNGGTPDAYKYIQDKPDVEIKYLYELVDFFLLKAVNQHPLNPRFITENIVKTECQKLISVSLEAFKAFKTLKNTLGNNSVLKRLLPS